MPDQEKDEAEEFLAEAEKDRASVLEERRQKLGEAKEADPDKEPFDIKKFGELFDLADDHGQVRLPPERVEELEMEYYLNFKDAKTLEQFAEMKADLEARSGG
jgi:hypothetical protein